MNVIINNIPFEYNEYDNLTTFKQKIAYYFQTLPTFIGPIDIDKKQKEVPILFYRENLLTKGMVVNDDSPTFQDFLENNKISTYFSELIKPKNIKDLIKLWITYSNSWKEIRESDQSDEFFNLILIDKIRQTDVEKYYPNISTFFDPSIPDNINNYKKKLNLEIVKSNEKIDLFNRYYKEISQYKSSSHAEFIKKSSSLMITTNIHKNKYSLATIFSFINCTINTPFMTFNNIFKIYENFNYTFPDVWKIPSDDTEIVLQLFTKNKEIEDSDLKSFVECVMKYNDDDFLQIEIKDIEYSKEIKQELLKQRILSVFSFVNEFNITKENEESIKGLTIFPNEMFNTYLMSDMIMNQSIFSNFMTVDESFKSTKETAGLYLHYFIQGYEGTCSIMSKKTVKNDPDIRHIDKKTLELGQHFIRLQFSRTKTMKNIYFFIDIFSKLINAYKEKYNNVLTIYKDLLGSSFVIDDFVEEKKDLKDKPIKEIAPDLFLNEYATHCQHKPIIIDDKYVPEYSKTKRVMTFPKDEKEGDQYNYVCEKNPYIHIGLQKNKLSNNDKYQYIPCCFEKDQTTKNSSYFKEYFLGEEKKKGIQQNVLVKNKFVQQNEVAILPENINKLFESYDDNYNYYRKGVVEEKYRNQSFLACVLETVAADKKTSLIAEYDKLINYPNIAVASQEHPGKTSTEMRTILRNKNEYMEPRAWIRLCETVYRCKIIIFSRKGNDGVICFPYHKSIYLEYKNSDIKKYVFVYEHKGTDESTPQCELIVSRLKTLTKEDPVNHYFVGRFPQKVEEFYKKMMNQYYYFDEKVYQLEEFVRPQFEFANYQFIDQYGKMRALIGNDIVLFTDPMPPLNLPTYKGNIYKKVSLEKLTTFIKQYDFEIVQENKNEMILRDKRTNYYFTVMFDIIDNKLKNILDMKKISIVLIEYFIYYYSFTLKENPINNDTIRDFIKTYVTISKTDYIVPKTPSVSIDFLVKHHFIVDSKFVISNKEILERLIYSLQLRISNNITFVKDYYNKVEIDHFYNNLSDYIQNHNLVFDNFDIFAIFDNRIYENVQPLKKSYFMKLSEKIAFVKETDTVQNAQNMSSNWIEKRKISTDEPKTEFNTDFLVYHSNNDIKHKILDKQSASTNNVLLYKKDDTIHSLTVAFL